MANLSARCSDISQEELMALVNVMENIVEEKLHRMLESEDCCKCDRCFEDMKAKALNLSLIHI